MSSLASQGQGVSIDVVVWPACLCGLPYTAHSPAGCDGYRPSRGVEPPRTVVFSPPPGFTVWRRALTMALWAVERRTGDWRRALL